MNAFADSGSLEAAKSLAALTTLRVGGPAGRLVIATTEGQLIEAVRAADAEREPLLILAGGSNVVVSDEGWPGVVVHLQTRGIVREVPEARDAGDAGKEARLHVQAGEPWDDLVAFCVANGIAGLECLSGIPGSVGATPIQNVGAYGQEVAERIRGVRVLDRHDGAVRILSREECEFGYRSSRFRGSDRWVVLEVLFELTSGNLSEPIRYAELARALQVEVGERAPLAAVRDAVLALRRGKGMVIDEQDPDSVSAGSFFTNPILEPGDFEQLARRVDQLLGPGQRPPAFPEADGRIKTSAAWLIERAGFVRGFGDGQAGISAKHTLALVNRGGATTSEVVAVAREIAAGVRERFGVELRPEPIFVGHSWESSDNRAPAKSPAKHGPDVSVSVTDVQTSDAESSEVSAIYVPNPESPSPDARGAETV